MSGRTLGGLAGAAIGAFVFPAIGAAFGASIGSALGGIIKPDVIEAPDPGDAVPQSIQPGAPRAVVFGHAPPFPGQIIGGEKVARKITVKTKQGKGGPTVKEKRFLLTSAIGAGEGPAKFLRIWRDGIVVLDRRTSFPPGWEGYSEEVKVAQKKFLESARLYEGTDDQLPDPALEAIYGVGNTPYFRGTCYIVDEDVDRTATRGTVAQYLFEMASCGTVITTGNDFLEYEPEFYYPFHGDGVDLTGNHGDFALYNDATWSGGGLNTGDGTGAGYAGLTSLNLGDAPDGECCAFIALTIHEEPPHNSNIAAELVNDFLGYVNWSMNLVDAGGSGVHRYLRVIVNAAGGGGATCRSPNPIPVGQKVICGFRCKVDLLECLINGDVVASVACVGGLIATGSANVEINEYFHPPGNQYTVSDFIGFRYATTDAQTRNIQVLMGVVPVGFIPVPDASGAYYNPTTGESISAGIAHDTVDECAVTLQEIVEGIAERCDLPAERIDASELAGIEVPGLLVTGGNGKDNLATIMLAYQFDLPEYE